MAVELVKKPEPTLNQNMSALKKDNTELTIKKN
jgi:hypothetical protein